MVKGVVNGVTTYYPSHSYNKVVNGATTTIEKFYSFNGQTVATSYNGAVSWMTSDQLGSASVTANADGTWKSEIRYTAFGEIQMHSRRKSWKISRRRCGQSGGSRAIRRPCVPARP